MMTIYSRAVPVSSVVEYLLTAVAVEGRMEEAGLHTGTGEGGRDRGETVCRNILGLRPGGDTLLFVGLVMGLDTSEV